MTNAPPIGTMVRAHTRYSAQYTPDPGGICATGVYRVTAVRGNRVYVSHVSGAQYCAGMHGWDNQWYRLGDERVEVIV